MFMSKFKTTVAVVLGIGLLLVPVTLVTRASAPVEQNGQAKAGSVHDNEVQGADDRKAQFKQPRGCMRGL